MCVSLLFRLLLREVRATTNATPLHQTSLSQIEHLLQTAEAIRRDGKPEWMQVAGLVHDLGKLLYFFGSEGQWDVVGVSVQLVLRPRIRR